MRSIADQVLLGVAVALLTFAGFLYLGSPTHTAVSSVYLQTAPNDGAALTPNGVYELNQVKSLATLAHGTLVTRPALSRTGADLTEQQLSDAITVSALPQTVVVQVSVTLDDAQEAQRLCAAVTSVLIKQSNLIQSEGSGGTNPARFVALDRAHLASEPSALIRAALLAGLLGVLAALVAPRGREQWRQALGRAR